MKIYVVGDSISIQYGPFLRQYLDGIMEYSRKEGEELARLNLDAAQGANGGDSGMVRKFLDARARAGGVDADVLLLNCGLHDIKVDPVSGKRQVAIDAYEENLREIVRIVGRMKRPRLVWVRTTPCDEKVHNKPGMAFHRFSEDGRLYNEAADRVMREAGVPMIDLYAFTLNLGPELYCDHVHFHPSIREKQAAFIAGWLTAFPF